MSPPPTEKTDRFTKVAQNALTPLVALVAILAIVLIAPMYFKSDEPVGTSSSVVDERIAHIAEQIDELSKVVATHMQLDMHHGARVQFTVITSELLHIQEALTRIEKRLDKIDDGG